ncbi:MAG: isocitrate/isopropylmalate family dehydrogenase, partial [Longimicrobiales bacterium]
MKARIVLLPGDGVGPEVLEESRRVLQRVGQIRGHDLELREALIGGAAIRTTGRPLPEETSDLCLEADAALLGAVGDPAFDGADVRPEQALLALRRKFGLFANLRPVWVFPQTAGLTPFRPGVLDDVDILFVRELTGGIYFGPRQEQGEGDRAFDTLLYSVEEVERIAHVAFRAARARRKKLTSVDKANVLASSRLWRRTVERVAERYPEVEVEHLLVDAFAMHILRRPSTFDVVLTGNMFGDILTDEAS